MSGCGARQESTSQYQREDAGSNPCQPHQIKLVQVTNNSQRKTFTEILEGFHSYLPSPLHVGRRIDYLIYNGSQPVGLLGFGSHILPEPKAIMNFIGWNMEQRRQNFNKVVNNYRACFTRNAPRNLGSRSLSIAQSLIKHDWKAKYGDKPVLLTTLVIPSHKGTIHAAAGWFFIGETKGFENKGKGSYVISKRADFAGDRPKSIREATVMKKPKKIFVKPLHRYWRNELLSTDEQENP